MPVSEESKDQLPVTSASENTFKTLHIVGDDSPVFLQVMLMKESLIRQNLLEYAGKNLLKVEISQLWIGENSGHLGKKRRWN